MTIWASFIPVIASLYFSLSLLEASGYMARAAFVMDRAMRAMPERKGRVRRLPPGTICGMGCSQCSQAAPELYEIIEE